MTNISLKKSYRKEIDGLRVIAIIPVILYHTFILKFAEGGFIGVDIFFVISGYLITTLLLEEISQNNSIKLGSFYLRRIRRIVPLLFFITILSIYPAYKLLFPFTFAEFGQSLMGISLFLPNISFLLQGGYFAEPDSLKPLLHTWSLGIEEQYYIFFPVLLILVWKYFKNKFFLIMIIIFLSSLLFANDLSDGLFTKLNFLSPMTRLWELLAGSIVAYKIYFVHNRSINGNNLLSMAGLILIIFSFIFFNQSTKHPSFFTLIPVLGTCMIILYTNNSTFVGKVLSTNFFVLIGKMSYSLYLWHFPLFVFSRHYNFLYSDSGNNFYNLDLTIYLMLITLTFILSYYSWKYIEQPFRQKKIPTKFLLSSCLFGFIVIFSSGYFINKNDGLIERFPKKAVTFLNYNYSQSPKILINSCQESLILKIKKKILFKKYEKKNIHNVCRKLGINNIQANTVLIGDSFNHGMLEPLNNYLVNENKSIYYDVTSCTSLENFMNSKFCDQTFNIIINDEKIKKIIFFYRWSNKFYAVNTYDNDLYCGEFKCAGKNQANLYTNKERDIHKKFSTKIKKLIEANKEIIIIYPNIRIGFDVPKYLASKIIRNEKPSASVNYTAHISKNLSTLLFFDSFKDNIQRIYPEKLFCKKLTDSCNANNDEKVFFWNKTHLSIDGGKLLLNLLIKKNII